VTKNKKTKEKSMKEKNMKNNKPNDKNDKKNKSGLNFIIIGIVAIVVIIVAVFLFKNLKPAQPEVQVLDPFYNGYIFNQSIESGLWNVIVKVPKGDVYLEFYYHPQQVENYSYNSNITKDMANIILRKGKFFIGYDVNLSDKGVAAIAGSEVSRITGKVFGIETKSGFVDSVEDDAIPVINCSIANYKNMVLEFRLGNETKIVYDDNYCIVIYAETLEDTVKLADFLDYKLLGVIKNKPSATNETNTSSSLVNPSADNSSMNVAENNKINLSNMLPGNI
jgi:hypothetical protein